ncbi:MAG TPA: type VI secretion system contractile sheath small subunit [Myxococcales bacterium]|jgi:type VI secretion system protein ImpB|nr:type VI secretion system contractile sheath small subunit [Myxococcales bacterium]
MAKEGSVAPKERVNIVYKSATPEGMEEVELPLKILMMGDYMGRQDNRPLEERKPINIDKSNFNKVMAEQNLSVDITVPDQLSGEKGAQLGMKLSFKNLADFEPDALVNTVPELKKLVELRAALTALKHPLGSVPAFRKKLQALLGDDAARQKLTAELGLSDKTENK